MAKDIFSKEEICKATQRFFNDLDDKLEEIDEVNKNENYIKSEIFDSFNTFFKSQINLLSKNCEIKKSTTLLGLNAKDTISNLYLMSKDGSKKLQDVLKNFPNKKNQKFTSSFDASQINLFDDLKDKIHEILKNNTVDEFKSKSESILDKKWKNVKPKSYAKNFCNNVPQLIKNKIYEILETKKCETLDMSKEFVRQEFKDTGTGLVKNLIFKQFNKEFKPSINALKKFKIDYIRQVSNKPKLNAKQTINNLACITGILKNRNVITSEKGSIEAFFRYLPTKKNQTIFSDFNSSSILNLFKPFISNCKIIMDEIYEELDKKFKVQTKDVEQL